MATPTEAEVTSQFTALIDLLDETAKFGGVNSPNWLGLEDTLGQALEGDYLDEIMGVVRAGRSSINTILDPAYGRALLSPILRQWAKISASPDISPDNESDEQIVIRLYDRLVTASKSVKERAFSYGSASAGGSNAGNGSVYRCTKNPDAYNLEACTPETKVFRCTKDYGLGAGKHQEVFEVLGPRRYRDSLLVNASGYSGTMTALTGADSILQNADFGSYDSASTPTSVPGWKTSAGAADLSAILDIDTTNYYRLYGSGVDATPGQGAQSAKWIADGKIVQKAIDFRTQLRDDVPYVCQLAYNRSINSATGQLDFRVGNITTTVASLAGASAGWNVLRATLGGNSWFKNLKEADFNVEIEKSGSGTSGLLVSEVIIAPMSLIDGSFYSVIGASTPFLYKDYFTIADSVATDSVVQKWLWRLYAFGSSSSNAWRMMWVPSGTPTITDP